MKIRLNSPWKYTMVRFVVFGNGTFWNCIESQCNGTSTESQCHWVGECSRREKNEIWYRFHNHCRLKSRKTLNLLRKRRSFCYINEHYIMKVHIQSGDWYATRITWKSGSERERKKEEERKLEHILRMFYVHIM